MQVLLATTNPDKVREIRALVAGATSRSSASTRCRRWTLRGNGTTFAENARLEARYYATASGMAAIAEDSGLRDRRARRRAPASSPALRRRALDVSRSSRSCTMLDARGSRDSATRFVCALAVADADGSSSKRAAQPSKAASRPRPRHTASATSPIFFYPPEGCTLAEVSDE
jgi:XTP/dITP diphosphohydrolase